MKINPIKQKVYKVMYVDEFGKLYSCVSEIRSSPFCILYEKDKLIKPKVGKIFTFSNLEDAKEFYWINQAIYSAWGYGNTSGVLRLGTASFSGVDESEVQDFWKNSVKNKNLLFEVPKHTVLCESIRLIERII